MNKSEKNEIEFLELMHNIIDCSLTLEHAKYIIQMKYPELLPIIAEGGGIEHYAALYHLKKKLQKYKK